MFATLLYEKAVGASGSGDDSVTEIPELLGLPNIKVDKGFLENYNARLYNANLTLLQCISSSTHPIKLSNPACLELLL